MKPWATAPAIPFFSHKHIPLKGLFNKMTKTIIGLPFTENFGKFDKEMPRVATDQNQMRLIWWYPYLTQPYLLEVRDEIRKVRILVFGCLTKNLINNHW